MTGPTPDFSGNIAPGLYHAEGDPPGTVRQWDGTQWVGGPVPAPPGAMAAPMHPRDRFGGVGIRIGAAVLDAIIFFVLILALAVPLIAADLADDGNSSLGSTEFDGWSLLLSLMAMGVQVLLIRQFGGTPGKLIVGLRITEADGVTTPPGWGPSAMRVVPFAILGNIPLIGAVTSLVIIVLCLVWVSGDAERRSPYDRIGATRVVYKNKL